MDTQFVPVDLNPAATEEAARRNADIPQPVVDPFRDDLFAQPYQEPGNLQQELENIANEGKPQPEPAPAAPEPVAAQPPAEPEPEPQPEVHAYEDGSKLTVEKTAKGWEATLDTGVPGSALEVFRGRTKDE